MKKHIVALSGGKDSTALALRLSEIEPRDYVYMCTPTGDELPVMERHWEKLENILNQPIRKVTSPKWVDFKTMCEKKKMLPSFHIRFCTEYLKIEPAQAFYGENEPCITYVGLRADEPKRTGITGGESRFPLKEWGWGLREVWSYLKCKGITIPKRTDCARCFFQRKGEWWELWKSYPEIYADAEKQEADFGNTFLTQGKWGPNFPHSLEGMRKKFEGGYLPRKADIYYPMFGDFETKCRVCSL